MMVGIDEAGQHDHAAGVDLLIRLLGQLIRGAGGLDHVVSNEQPSTRDLAWGLAHRQQNFGISQQ